jgi:hypothetical protein
MEPMASQVRNHHSQKNYEAHLQRALAFSLQKTANQHSQSDIGTSHLALSIVLKIANVRAIVFLKQDDDNTDQEISNDESEDPGESNIVSHIKEDDLDIRQDVLHVD